MAYSTQFIDLKNDIWKLFNSGEAFIMILALETSTDICSVVLRLQGGELIEKRTEERGSHSEQLLLFVSQLMEEHQIEIPDLEALIVSRGPGSYTGLRISASTVKGLLFQYDVPLVSVNTLASFAARVTKKNPDINRIHAVIDARRVHLYHQFFRVESGEIISGDEVEVLPIKKAESMIKTGDAVIGTGLERINTEVLDRVEVYDMDHISAESLFCFYDCLEQTPFAVVEDPREFEPRYYTSRQVK